MIAESAGKSPRECDDIYYVALLHDVGKIGIPEAIINKEGKLTDEEYAVIKQHSALGAQILQSISEIPYLSLGPTSITSVMTARDTRTISRVLISPNTQGSSPSRMLMMP